MRKMHHITWYSLSEYLFCGLIGFLLRFLQDRKKEPKPDWWFQAISSTVLSYVAYYVYVFYKMDKVPMELWIVGLSWMGSFIITTADYVAKNGIVIYLRKAATEFLAITKKQENEH